MESHTVTGAGAPGGSVGRRFAGNDITMADALFFLRAWSNDPLRVAAIAPSGTALADLITSEITPQTGPVLELGPGTGVFTRALLKRGVPPEALTLVESGAEFAEILQRRFPQVRVLWMDAARLPGRHLFDDAPAGAVVSGLPLLSMSQRQIFAILAGAFGALRHGGAFYQFTYGPCCPIPRRIMKRLDLTALCIGRAYLNIPPAAVYRITRRAESSGEEPRKPVHEPI